MSLFKTNISKVLKAFNQEVVSPKLDLKANKTYVDGELSKKANTSHGTHVTYSTNAPLSNGTASAGSAATVARTDHVHPLQTTISGNAGTATKLQTARTISLTGDVEGSTAFDGSSNKSISTVVNKLSRKDISGSTININDYNLASGSPKVALYVVHTNGGSQNITNIPVAGNPFILDVELVRWVSSSDYITKQTFVSSSTKSTYVRWCTNGTWSGWTTEGRMTTTPTSGQIVVADGNTGGIKTSGFTIATSVPSGAKFTDTVYTHPNDSNTRHVTDSEKSTWNAKETTTGAQQKADAALASAKSYTDHKVASFVDSAPETLDTLNELATALGNDPNFATTVSNKIGTKADTTYVNQELGKKANTSHNQAANTITAMTGYSKPSSTSAIATTDSLNAAIGKLEKALDGKQASGSYAASSHTHNYAGSSSAGGAATSALTCTGNSATATKATQDSAGQQINKTYIKGLSVSGRTITYTKGDGTTGTITTQDTNTTYSTGTASALGLTKLYTGTGTATDGTMTQAAINTALSGKAASSHTHNYAATSHNHGLLHDSFGVTIADTTTDNGWSMINGSYNGFLLKSIRSSTSAPAWLQGKYSAGIAFGGADTKGVMSVAYSSPSVRFAGGNGSKPVWYFTVNGSSGKTYNMDSLAANTANTLVTARTINGTSFNGSANITTANWGTARTLTIGNTGKSVNGSANISWTLSEIGAASSSHNHDSVYTKISNNAYGTGKFNSATGVTISIGKTMSSTGYKVNITPTSNPGGSLGEFWVESKTTTSFVVKCSGSTTTTTFDWTVSI